MADIGIPPDLFPGGPGGEASATTGSGSATGAVTLPGAPTGYLQASGGGRLSGAIGLAKFTVGEKDFLRAFLKTTGTYLVTGLTFQLLQAMRPVVPPTGATDYTSPVGVARYTIVAAQQVEGQYWFDTTLIPPGTYAGLFSFSVTTQDGDSLVLDVEFPIYVYARGGFGV